MIPNTAPEGQRRVAASSGATAFRPCESRPRYQDNPCWVRHGLKAVAPGYLLARSASQNTGITTTQTSSAVPKAELCRRGNVIMAGSASVDAVFEYANASSLRMNHAINACPAVSKMDDAAWINFRNSLSVKPAPSGVIPEADALSMTRFATCTVNKATTSPRRRYPNSHGREGRRNRRYAQMQATMRKTWNAATAKPAANMAAVIGENPRNVGRAGYHGL